ncbi:MAG: hypothetical protein ACPGJS_13005 [Flammeovirgaceae bacterium]
MGYSSWSDDAFSVLKHTRKSKATKDIFTSKSLSKDMDPKGVNFRESRDSDAHPQTVPIMVFLDVTGSMGRIPEVLVREKLGALMNTLLAHGVEGPQVLFGAIGDHITDRFPLQIGQFESGTQELDQWLTTTYLEGGGGGQYMESYLLAWLFAARHTSTDSFEKRGQKGFLFTIGDEWTWEGIDEESLKRIMGYSNCEPVSAEELLEEAKRMYEVFHIHINEASYRDHPKILNPWKELLGERLIILEDYNAIAETIASTVAVLKGSALNEVTAAFDASIASTVSKALAKVHGDISTTSDEGILKL